MEVSGVQDRIHAMEAQHSKDTLSEANERIALYPVQLPDLG